MKISIQDFFGAAFPLRQESIWFSDVVAGGSRYQLAGWQGGNIGGHQKYEICTMNISIKYTFPNHEEQLAIRKMSFPQFLTSLRGSCFSVVHPVRSSVCFSFSYSSQLFLHTHNSLHCHTHTAQSHTTTLSHATLSHTHTHALFTHCHTHTTLSHTTLSHITLSNTPTQPHTHARTHASHNIVTHNNSFFTHTTLSHIWWQAWPLVTSMLTLCGRCGTYGTGLPLVARLVAAAPGVAPDDMEVTFVWHAWH